MGGGMTLNTIYVLVILAQVIVSQESPIKHI